MACVGGRLELEGWFQDPGHGVPVGVEAPSASVVLCNGCGAGAGTGLSCWDNPENQGSGRGKGWALDAPGFESQLLYTSQL